MGGAAEMQARIDPTCQLLQHLPPRVAFVVRLFLRCSLQRQLRCQVDFRLRTKRVRWSMSRAANRVPKWLVTCHLAE